MAQAEPREAEGEQGRRVDTKSTPCVN